MFTFHYISYIGINEYAAYSFDVPLCLVQSPLLLVVAGGVILFLVRMPIRRVYCNVRVLPTKIVGGIWPINAPDVFFHLAQNSNIIFVACTSHSTPWHSVSKRSYKEIVC